jgi:hypothetical protein
MVKKSFKNNIKSGIDNFIQSSTAEAENENKESGEEENDYVGVHFKAPKELKREINLYCAKHGLIKKDFLISVISEYLNK